MRQSTKTLDAPNVITKTFSMLDHLRISLFWFGTNFLWGALLGPLLGSQIAKMAPANPVATIGEIYSVAAIPALVVPLIFGPLSDRCRARMGRRRPYIGAGVAVALLGLGIMEFAFRSSQLTLYVVGYFAVQIGSNTALAAYNGVIPDLVPVAQRGAASGYMAAMSSVGTLVGALAVGEVFHTGQGTLVIIAATLGVLGLATMFLLDETQATEVPAPLNWKSYFASLWIDPRKYPDFAWVWLTRAMMMLGFYMIQPFLLFYMRDVLHLAKPETDSAVVFGVILLAAAVSGYFGGKLSDRVGRKPIVILSTSIIGVMCLVFIGLHNLPQALAAGFVFGIGYGAYISVDWALGTDVLPKDTEAATDMAVWHISMTFPQQIGPILAGDLILAHFRSGFVIEADGKHTTYALAGYAWVFGVAALAVFTSGLLVRKVKGVK